jgi:hypothetical protein
MAFVLNDDELAKFQEELDKSDVSDAIKLVENVTTESLGQLQEDLEKYLKEEKKADETKPSEDINPFTALFSFLKKKPEAKEKTEKTPEGKMRKENYAESVVRAYAEKGALAVCYKFYSLFKKAQGMADIEDYEPGEKPRKGFG